MKVGDYVRTKNGYIGKIIDYHNEPTDYYFNCYETDLKTTFTDKFITEYDDIKSSPKIINLIKEGDLVNNHIVGQILYENQTIDNIKYLDLEGVNILVCNDDIKSIVTKEQFSSMEYKVGDNDDKDK